MYFDPQLERWLITGYREVASVLADQRFSSKGAARLSRPDQQADHSSTHTEPGTQHDPERPPVQTKLRNLVNRAFTPRPVDPLRPRIQELTNGLLDKVQASAEMEVSSDLAYPLPVAVITVLLGAEVEMAKQLRRWTDTSVACLAHPSQHQRCSTGLTAA